MISSPTAVSKKKHLKKGQGSATAEALELEKDRSALKATIAMKKVTSGKSKKKKKHSKNKTPRRKQTSSRGIVKGWSPAVIRGTSVTAHTPLASCAGCPHHHKLKDSVSVSEEQMQPLAGSYE